MSDEIHERSLAMVMSELKAEFSEFVRTRYQMLASELQSKLGLLKLAAPMLFLAAALSLVAFMLFTVALVAVIAIGMGGGGSVSAGGWALALVIVGGCYLIVGGAAGWFAWRQLSQGLAPKRTLRVLKQDQVWLQNEARSQL